MNNQNIENISLQPAYTNGRRRTTRERIGRQPQEMELAAVLEFRINAAVDRTPIASIAFGRSPTDAAMMYG